MPEPSADPVRAALRAAFRRWSVRGALAAVGFFVVVALLAPFIAGEVALVWWDARGLRFPVLGDLFNRWSYNRPHDLFFNLALLGAPVLVGLWWLLRRKGPFLRLGACLALLIVATVAAWNPWGGGSLWAQRKAAPETVQRYQELAGEGKAPFAILPPVRHRFDSTWAGAVLLPPGARNPETGARFWLGTDSAGKDVLAQMIFGARISLTVGLVSTGLAMLIGTLIGAISGYFAGRVDILLQRVVEIMMCFPTFILILVVVSMLGRDIFVIMTVIGLTSWAGTARMVRGEFLAQGVRDYVVAAEAAGLPRWRIMFRHILPNALTPLIIAATFGIAGSVGAESGLSFVGMGDVTVASWGVLLEQGRQNISYPWLIYAPGLAVFALIVALNQLGNTLREALDPKAAR